MVRLRGASGLGCSRGKTLMPSEHCTSWKSEKVLGDHLRAHPLTHLQQTLGYSDVALKLGEH